MRRFKYAAACAAFACASVVSAALAENIQVPIGVKVQAALAQKIDSGTARVGDTFSFKTTKDAQLGDIDVPVGTLGSGRLAVVTAATGKAHGSLALQADSIELADGRSISVNIDSSQPLKGRLSKKRTIPFIVPLPGVIVPGAVRTTSGDLILDPGTAFQVVTVAPRRVPAPLLTAPPPTPSPASMPKPAST
jgi:hypothetical protein